jgi:hypothetical protein
MHSNNIVLFTLCWVAFFCSVVFIVLQKSLNKTKRHVFCPIISGLLGLYNFKLLLLLKKVVLHYIIRWTLPQCSLIEVTDSTTSNCHIITDVNVWPAVSGTQKLLTCR